VDKKATDYQCTCGHKESVIYKDLWDSSDWRSDGALEENADKQSAIESKSCPQCHKKKALKIVSWH